MQIDFITYIYVGAASILFADMSGIPQRIKWAYKKNSIKPFDCSMCLSFWISIIAGYFLNLHWINIIGNACTTSFVVVILFTIYKKIT